MWHARVEYMSDNQRADVPVSFFKDHETVLSELRDEVIRESYDVFWSPREEDTPESIRDEQGVILDCERVFRALGHKKGSTPTIGYYKARIIQYEESLEALLKLFENPKGRRSLQSSGKSASNQEKSKSTKGSSKVNKENQTKARDHNMGLGSQSAKPSGEDKSSSASSGTALSPVKRKQTVEDSENVKMLKLEVERLQCEVKKRDALIKALSVAKSDESWKDQCLALCEENRRLTDLNNRWQEKELGRSSRTNHERSSSSRHKSEDRRSTTHKSKETEKAKGDKFHQGGERKEKTPCARSLFAPQTGPSSSVDVTSNESREVIQNDGLNFDTDLDINMDDIDLSIPVDILDESGSVVQTLPLPSRQSTPRDENSKYPSAVTATSLAGSKQSLAPLPLRNQAAADQRSSVLPQSPSRVARNPVTVDQLRGALDGLNAASGSSSCSVEDYAFGIVPDSNVQALNQNQVDAANKVASGHRGDARFIKQLMDLLWKREDLANRSATGKACPNKQQSVARTEVTPEKKSYLQCLLVKRIELEGDSSGKDKRVKGINSIISSKIKVVRRGLGLTDQEGNEY